MIRELSEINNPDIIVDKDVLLYKSGYVPCVGDIIIVQGLQVVVTSVSRIYENSSGQDWDAEINPKHNWQVEITGDDIPALRELLTYQVNK